jgi:hypothetical protein
MSKPKRNREDFMFMKKEGARLVKMPGSLNGLDFVLDTVKNCSVYILDRTAQITADEVNDSKLYIGPVEGSIFLRDCHNCTISVICRQFRLKKCTNLTISVHSASDPSIELCSDLRFAPFNFKYPTLDQQVQAAGIDVSLNFWSQIFDFNVVSGESHWSLLPPDAYYEEEYDEAIEGSPAVNPIPRHVAYGGALTDEIILGSQQQPGAHGGLMSFSISTSQREAEAAIAQSLGSPSTSTDPFGALSNDPFAQSSDPFAASSSEPLAASSAELFAAPPSNPYSAPSADPFAQSSDPFAAPSSDPFANQGSDPFAAPSSASSDPFSGPSSDPFSGPSSDPFGGPSSDPFSQSPAAPEAFSQPREPLSSHSSQPSESSSHLFDSAQPVQSSFFGESPADLSQQAVVQSEEDAEEIEMRRLRDEEHQERMQKLYEKEQIEREQKEERRSQGKEQLMQWNSDRLKQNALRRELNREQQTATSQMKAAETPWKKVASMVDFKETGDRKELGRMRGVLLAQKNR